MTLRIIVFSFAIAMLFVTCRKEENQPSSTPESLPQLETGLKQDSLSGVYLDPVGSIFNLYLFDNLAICDYQPKSIKLALPPGFTQNYYGVSCTFNASESGISRGIQIYKDSLRYHYRWTEYGVPGAPSNGYEILAIKKSQINKRTYLKYEINGTTHVYRDSNGVWNSTRVDTNVIGITYWEMKPGTIERAFGPNCRYDYYIDYGPWGEAQFNEVSPGQYHASDSVYSPFFSSYQLDSFNIQLIGQHTLKFTGTSKVISASDTYLYNYKLNGTRRY